MANSLGKIVPPSINKTAFHCPLCGTKTTQFWHNLLLSEIDGLPEVHKTSLGTKSPVDVVTRVDAPARAVMTGQSAYISGAIANGFISICMECSGFALWLGSKMALPKSSNAPPAHKDMPAEIKGDYEEAARILSESPRGAAALLRLAVEKLCIHLGYKKGMINEKIEKMVDDGLPLEVEKALDVVRVIGNGAVHPGRLDLKDDLETATKLFEIVNYIVMDRITRPNELAQLFGTVVTDGQKEAIARRRAKKGGG